VIGHIKRQDLNDPGCFKKAQYIVDILNPDKLVICIIFSWLRYKMHSLKKNVKNDRNLYFKDKICVKLKTIEKKKPHGIFPSGNL
jgi:hypothetical protein